MTTITLGHHQLVIADVAASKALELATRAAKSDFPVLLCGPSGSGKELFARYIHSKSNRINRPFVSINCAAIPENLLEAELFGFEKGAFTGAVAQRIGKFELASAGTLLLDEISEMQLSLQAKLLRALQENEIDRLGGRSPVAIDTRIIATSNREPMDLIRNGKFREDLFYRINVIRIDCPALAGRAEAIESLARAFIGEWAEKNHERPPELDAVALKRLCAYNWPGNVRELKNAIDRAIFLAEGQRICERHLQGMDVPSTKANEGQGTLAEMERQCILHALNETHGNRTRAALRLGISVRTLRNKLKEYAP